MGALKLLKNNSTPVITDAEILALSPVVWIKNLNTISSGKFVDSSGNNHTLTAGTTVNANDSITFNASDTTVINALTAAGVYSTFYTNDTTPKKVPLRNIQTLIGNIVFFDYFNNATLLIFPSAISGDNLAKIKLKANTTYPINWMRTFAELFTYNIYLWFSAYQKPSNNVVNHAPHRASNVDNFQLSQVTANLRPLIGTQVNLRYWQFNGTEFFKSDITSNSFFSNTNLIWCFLFKFDGSTSDGQYYLLDSYTHDAGHNQTILFDNATGSNILKYNGFGTGSGANGSYAGYSKNLLYNLINWSYQSTTRNLLDHVLTDNAAIQQDYIDTPGVVQSLPSTYFNIGTDFNGGNGFVGKLIDIFVSNTNFPSVLKNALISSYWVNATKKRLLNLVFVGDSLTAGNNASDQAHSYPSVCNQLCKSGRKHAFDTYYQGGIAGLKMTAETSHQMSATREAVVTGRVNSTYYNILIIWGDWVNAAAGGVTKETLYQNTKTYATYMKTFYDTVIVVTPQPGYFVPDYEITRVYIRNQELAEFPSLGIMVCDIYNDPHVGQPGCNTDTTYWDAGGLHMTDAGYNIVANLVYNFMLTNGILSNNL